MTIQDANLTLKSHLNDLDLRHSVSADDGWIFEQSDQLLLLIHGFRNDEDEAANSYNHFRRKLARIDASLGASTKTFSWPSSPSIFDGLAYFSNVDKIAQAAGERLAAFLNKEINSNFYRRQYVLVAHSLGSRVVLETMKTLHDAGVDIGSRFRIVLMAAAVRVEDFETTSAKNYRECVSALKDSIVFFSPDDRVLRRAFVAGMDPKSKEAVGLQGNPTDAWHSAPEDMTGNGHSDYWADRGDLSSTKIAEFLGFAISNPLSWSMVDDGAVLPGGVLN